MGRAGLLGFLAVALGDSSWQNTEHTTLAWRLLTQERNEGMLEKFLFSIEGAHELRSEDGRGALFWAWEGDGSSNVHGLATLKVLGQDLLTDTMLDANKEAPHNMCRSADGEPCSSDEKKEIVLQAESLVADVLKRKQEFEDEQAEAQDPLVLGDKDEDEEEEDDGTVLRKEAPPPKKKAKDDDDDLLGGGIVADEL